MNKKYFILVALVAVILVAVIVFNQQGQTPSEQASISSDNENEEIQISDTEKVTQKEPSDLMKKFPAGFPFEEGVENQSGYQFIPAKSTDQQNTLTYTSKLTLKENAVIFKKFLDDNDFEISNKVEETNQYFYYATKDNNDLSILVQENLEQVTVSVSYLVR